VTAALLLSLLACGGDSECSAEVECSFGTVCVEGQCITKACATSAQCPMETTCDAGRCVDGCAEDVDCYPGDACSETGSCEPAACRDTRLDCGFGQFCNEFTGSCYDAGGYYCKPCNDDNDCGGNGNYCTGSGYCGVTCESDNDCPSGYQCYPFVDLAGDVQFYQCYTACWVYADEGGGTTSPAGPIEPVPPPECELVVETAG